MSAGAYSPGCAAVCAAARSAMSSSTVSMALHLWTDVSQIPGATAVLHVLQLHQQAIRISEIQLWRPIFRAAAIFHSHADVVAHWTDRTGLILARLHAHALERLQDVVGFEIVDAHAEVIDAGRARGRSRAAAATAGEHQEFDAAACRKRRRGRPLVRTNAHAEHLSEERIRLLSIAREHGHVTVAVERNQPLTNGSIRRAAHGAKRS